MRIWLWPRRLRLRKRPPKLRRLVRKRRPHRTARDRLRAFGLSRFRYLWFIPILIALIAVAANLRVPRTTTVALAEPAGQVEFAGAEGIRVKSAKWRTSIPAGYRLAVDIGWENAGAPSPGLLVELSLAAGETLCAQMNTLPAGALQTGSSVTRLELDIPYNLKGSYRLELKVSTLDVDGAVYKAPLGALRVY